ncbi:DNA polymerase III, delta prime subunit [Polynucleobacter meluiroseus]|uniref:DNA polymerase III, delta prime subunit n=1 Tax=Polynucleobacter meluiroseus TaxID=1938814 RepID=A0A240E034_9BURK|nr:DNA polymerase III subunit delta' [Polynucleobacter meluiroseus]SNX28567.1 DNA polymerase III, delta prime subunit [Polynucleobacter meluiroseus]
MSEAVSHSAVYRVIAPWLQPVWEHFNFDSFPSAVLIHGQSGVGKFEFALQLAQALLCESKDASHAKPCNQCEACHWFLSANHPDFIALVPETHRSLLPHGDFDADVETPKKGRSSQTDSDGEASEKKEKKNIAIEEARSAIEGLSIGSHRGGNRVILVYPLEALRPDSANTLLKSLEEPPSKTIFILLANRLDRVLPTIRSRCRLVSAPRPDEADGLAWLTKQLGSLPALKLSRDAVKEMYNELGGVPYDVLQALKTRASLDEKDELTIALQASRYLLQSLAQGARIHWLETAEKIHKARYSELLATMQRWTADLQSVAQQGVTRYYPNRAEMIHGLAIQVRLPKLLRFWKALLQARRHETHPLANRIQLEALLSQYQQMFED